MFNTRIYGLKQLPNYQVRVSNKNNEKCKPEGIKPNHLNTNGNIFNIPQGSPLKLYNLIL